MTLVADTLIELDAAITALVQQRDFLICARQTLCDELLSNVSRGGERLQQLKLGILSIDRGVGDVALLGAPLVSLMNAAGFTSFVSPLPAVERQLEELQQRRAIAQAALDDG